MADARSVRSRASRPTATRPAAERRMRSGATRATERVAVKGASDGDARTRALVPQACESVGAPVLAADTVVHEEQTVGVVAVLYRAQPRIVLPPESLLPRRVEIVALRH